MNRKIFLSFLGTNNYEKCVYSYKEYQSAVVRFVQSALIDMCCKEWDNDDKILIFTTEDALNKNWKKLEQECQTRISLKNIDIPNGKNEEEIWKIFDIIYNQLENNDELYVDITHSFRSIPLLAASLLQYAKSLKNISVQAIYYGAFDNLGNARDIKTRIPNPNNRIAPIFNLTAFSEIQDWSVAANDFICYGNTQRLCALIKNNIKPVLRQTQIENNAARNLNTLNKQIKNVSLNIRTNRGKEIIKGKAPKDIIDILDSLETDLILITPLNPILEKLKESIQKIYKGENDTKNMLAAVEWCIEKQLIQEGFTLLQEGIISFLLKDDDYSNKDKRNFTSNFLNTFYSKGKEFDRHKNNNLSDKDIEILEESLKSLEECQALCNLFRKITEMRNDINHAGTSSQSLSADVFEKKLKNLFKQMKELIDPC
ncbi:MAG: TIGR02221 family CRISPR-associated protein [Prevotellaceae bacterium]|jgi:CRISPR-associated Csx2 family protein|nr:TIGR02221 family CRISPR-associated protein [Prevotellaceae bacterium]